MSSFFAKVFANLAVHGAQTIADGGEFFAAVEAEFQTIAHGEGGVAKVQAAVKHLGDIAAAGAKVVADVAG